MSDLSVFTSKIVIGKITDVSVEEGQLHDGSDALSYTMSVYNVKVEETLFGEHSDNVTLYLLGTPDSDYGITKPRVGESLVLFLHDVGRGLYSLASDEDAMFSINRNKTVISLSDEEFVSQYDGETLEFLVEKIQEAVLESSDENYQLEYNWRKDTEVAAQEAAQRDAQNNIATRGDTATQGKIDETYANQGERKLEEVQSVD
ncbi:MAG: hypothetical protein FWG33_02830 [Oscillospiraceae bacterium]|nr:hypothetical protein [Oscillospiraceae bacterium]